MYKGVFDIHAWKLSTHAFNEGDIRLYESLTSIGNGYMGMRGNFEEGFSGDSHTGCPVLGVHVTCDSQTASSFGSLDNFC